MKQGEVTAQTEIVSRDEGADQFAAKINRLTLTESATAQPDYIYIANSDTAMVTVTLPAQMAEGQIVEVQGKGSQGWRLAQQAGQTVRFSNSATTTGVNGYIQSNNRYDSVRVRCITANTEFVVNQMMGSLIRA